MKEKRKRYEATLAEQISKMDAQLALLESSGVGSDLSEVEIEYYKKLESFITSETEER